LREEPELIGLGDVPAAGELYCQDEDLADTRVDAMLIGISIRRYLPPSDRRLRADQGKRKKAGALAAQYESQDVFHRPILPREKARAGAFVGYYVAGFAAVSWHPWCYNRLGRRRLSEAVFRLPKERTAR
jgi:hypothetical protein